jgi:ssDNA thymidine ADP-ribosyltransferase, DarT
MDPRVSELQCIMPIVNMPSVVAHGILSYERAAKLKHFSVAMQPVQDKRDRKAVPGGLRLHQYANLYFDARNPMLYVRRGEAHKLCVLRVSTEVLQLEGTVMSDQNAASDYARFLAPSQWPMLDMNDIFARDWRHVDDQIRAWQHKSRKCAEVLVRHVVPPRSLLGAYVVDDGAATSLQATGFAPARGDHH